MFTFHVRVIINFVSYNYLDKLIVTQRLKKSPAFHKPQIFTTIFTIPSTKYYPEPDESNPSFPLCLFKAHFRIIFPRRHSHSNRWLQTTGTWRRNWLRHCSTSLRVAGSIPDGVPENFHWKYSFSPHYGVGVDSASCSNK